jgi:hypothetical protein
MFETMNSDFASVLAFLAAMTTGCLGVYFFYGFSLVTSIRKQWVAAAEQDGLTDDYFSQFAMLPVSGIAAANVLSGANVFYFWFIPVLVGHRIFWLWLFGPRGGRLSPFLKRIKHWKLTLFDGVSLAVTALCSALVALACIQIGHA